jgi:hypothetical protein
MQLDSNSSPSVTLTLPHGSSGLGRANVTAPQAFAPATITLPPAGWPVGEQEAPMEAPIGGRKQQ